MVFQVAAVVLNWNGWRDTVACVAALKRLDGPAPLVIVVDNASADDSVVQIRRAHPEVTLLQTGANLGFGGGCNVGIQAALARGVDAIWLVNNDAIPDSGALQALLAPLRADAAVGAVGGVLVDADGSGRVQVWGGARLDVWWGLARAVHSPGVVDTLSGACMLLRAQALQSVVGFDDTRYFMYWEDADISLRLRAAGWKLAVAPEARLTHKLSASLGQGSALLDRYFVTSGVRFLRRHAPWFGAPVAMVLRMALLRAARGQWARLAAVWAGWRAA